MADILWMSKNLCIAVINLWCTENCCAISKQRFVATSSALVLLRLPMVIIFSGSLDFLSRRNSKDCSICFSSDYVFILRFFLPSKWCMGIVFPRSPGIYRLHIHCVNVTSTYS